MKRKLQFFRYNGLSCEEKKAFSRFYDFCKANEKKQNNYYSFGYETFGLILYNFCKWLIADLDIENINEILFFSRDGYIIQQAFNLIPESSKFSAKYCYVSRRSLRVPTLWYGKESLFNLIFPTRYISIRDLLASVGLNPIEHEITIKKYGFEINTIVKGSELDTNKKLIEMFETLWSEIINNSKKEYESAIKYLESIITQKNVAIVDIGWRGTMQMYLSKLLKKAEKEVVLRGYYVTINSDYVRGLDMHGYFDNVNSEDEGCDKLRGYVGLIETLFLKIEGSTRAYTIKDNGDIEPLLDKYEYLDENGNLAFEAKKVIDIQEGALQFIKDYVKTEGTFLEEFSDKLTFHNLNEFANRPSLSDVEMFSNFRFYNNGTVSHLAKVKSPMFYLMHPKEFKNDFYESRWRIGFMKKLFIIPLPYRYIMTIIMKYTNNKK